MSWNMDDTCAICNQSGHIYKRRRDQYPIVVQFLVTGMIGLIYWPIFFLCMIHKRGPLECANSMFNQTSYLWNWVYIYYCANSALNQKLWPSVTLSLYLISPVCLEEKALWWCFCANVDNNFNPWLYFTNIMVASRTTRTCNSSAPNQTPVDPVRQDLHRNIKAGQESRIPKQYDWS